ncbi:MAG: hypothetical protein C5B49_13395 [Bdellovibrio sp.]|nr:MAG: hypothetical protein C5B49_13395 [Bdellovibrio sp.]
MFHASILDNEIWKEKAYLPGFSAIAAGVLAALAAHRFSTPPKWLQALLHLCGLAGVFVVICFNKWTWQLIHDATLLFLTMATASLLYCLSLPLSLPPRPLRATGWLRSMGRLSYEIYLVHMFVVWPVVDYCKIANIDPIYNLLWYSLAILGSWGLGWLIARFFSIPTEKALRNGLPGRNIAESRISHPWRPEKGHPDRLK